MLDGVDNRVASPVFVGRGEELTALGEALARARDQLPSTVLVGGEAGAGKSRLVREFSARAPEAYTLVGGCMELGPEGLAFAPFTAVLRQLVRAFGRDEVAGLLPGGPRELARLLPEFGEPPADTEEARARLFEHVLVLLERLAERQPLVLVIEDAHWADRSTRDLLVFLVHNLHAGAVLLVVTYRSDELHRTHPLRPLLVELERLESVRRFELAGLSQREVGQQMAAIADHDADLGAVDDVFALSAGNPLFVEALMTCDDPGRGCLPRSLRDLLFTGVERLPEASQRVLRVAAVGGVRNGHALLAAVTGLPETELTRALRAAVDGNVLVVDGDGYAFRHALIREAVHDDLLPGEHTRQHATFARVLEGDPGLVPDGRAPAELAHHWYAARDNARALSAAWRAAGHAGQALAYAEQLAMLERVLELWEQVPDAAELLGTDRVGVLELAVSAADASAEERAVALASEALRSIDAVEERGRAAILLEHRNRLRFRLGRTSGLDDLRQAVALLPADPPHPKRPYVLANFAQKLSLESAEDEAWPLAEEALTLGRELGDPYAEAQALITLATMNRDASDIDGVFAMFAEATAIGERIDEPSIVLRAATNSSDVLERIGEHERAVEEARQGMNRARAVGLARTCGSFLAINTADPLISLGRWDEAMETVQYALELSPPPAHRLHLQAQQGQVTLARGDAEPAAAAVADARATFGERHATVQKQLPVVWLGIQLCIAERRLGEALDQLEHVLEHPGLTGSPRYGWPVLAVGAQVCAELAVNAAVRPTAERTERVETMLATARSRATAVGVHADADRAYRATFAAEALSADLAAPQARFAAWEEAVTAWKRARQPYPRAQALLRAAEVAVVAEKRDVAADWLQTCARIAAQLGAVPLHRDARALAQRARLPLVTDSDTDSAGVVSTSGSGQVLGLTHREFDVLRLVTVGYSNRHVAEELFISAKTASVHVSNILAKLGVASRGEAAATAHRLRLFDDQAA